MENKEKIALNKEIKNYTGTNSFVISLRKQLKSNKYLERVKINNRKFKVLSDLQYKTAKEILKNE